MADADEDIDLLSAFIGAFDSDPEEEEAESSTQPPTATNVVVSKNTQEVVATSGLPSATENLLPPASKNQKKPLASAGRVLEECDIFSPNVDSKTNNVKDLFGDVSEDEDDEMTTKTSLNENGADIRRLMKDREQQSVKSTAFYDSKVTTSQIKNKWVSGSRVAHDIHESKPLKIPDLGLAIVNPKVSLDFLKKSMSAKELVLLSRVSFRNPNNKAAGDWITFGVIASKTETKRSSSGGEYIILRLVDMANVDIEVSLFLFGKCYDSYWKLPVATAVGLMNPSLMKNDKGNTRSAATMNINHESQLLVIGTSKDFGTCGSVTKSGNKCTNIVNKDQCDKCRFHTMQQHKAARLGRSELNTTFSAKEPSNVGNRLMSKLSTTRSADDCFTYGGKTYNTKATKPKTKVSLKGVLNRSAQKGNLQSALNLYQIKAEDEKRISAAAAVKRTKAEEHLEEMISRPSTASMQFVKHLVSKELKSGSVSSDAGLTVASVKPIDLIRHEKERFAKQLKERKGLATSTKAVTSQVQLSRTAPSSSATSMTASEYRKLKAKQKAKEVIMQKGGIHKEDVNATRKKLTPKQKEQVKRRFDESINSSSKDTDSEGTSSKDDGKEQRSKLKKLDVNSEAYLEIRNRKSINSHLVKQVQDERETEYFGIQEKKESYETKLLSTHLIEAEIYYCTQCDYQDWSLAKRCFEERHKYKKLPTLKRFFRCKSCKERLVTHEKFPTGACKKCGGANYEKAGMINEKKVTLAGQELSLRGNEESRLGSYDSTINLDVL